MDAPLDLGDAMGVEDACSPGSARACMAALGNCASGRQDCDADGAWGPCSIAPQRADSCVPGDDASCDGTPNGGCACSADVSCGPELEVGICRRGLSTCSAGVLGVCLGATYPSTRDCSSPEDNDCDGVADNTIDASCRCAPGSQTDCGPSPDSFGCARGTQTCELASGGTESRFGQCTFTPVADGTSCDDLDLLTLQDACQQGRCAGTALGRLAVGNAGVCAIRSGGAAFCWEGIGIEATRGSAPVRIALPGPARSVGVGARQACAVLESGELWCWGSNDAGQLGTGDLVAAPPSEPSQVASLPSARMVVPGAEGTAALDASGNALLWGGLPSTVYLSTDATFRSLVPVPIDGVSGASMLALGARHACALLGTGAVYCWGQNEFLQLGSGEQVAQPSARVVPGLGDAVFIAAGNTATCVVRESGEVTCWGNLGCSSAAAACVAPVTVPNLDDARQVSVGNNTACALRATGSVVCWGVVASAAGGTQTVVTPVAIAGISDAVALAATDEVHGGQCALLANDDIVCWSADIALGAVAPLPS